jgi:3-hydroxyacyl-CoA dehydrogenase/enoyl-CoA hydratase/3-hydroxybutyryl-CoA epimerase/enoyl-CoA isomerase
MDTLGNSNVVDQAKRYTALGPLYALPELLLQKAHQHQSWYPAVQPIDEAALQSA